MKFKSLRHVETQEDFPSLSFHVPKKKKRRIFLPEVRVFVMDSFSDRGERTDPDNIGEGNK